MPGLLGMVGCQDGMDRKKVFGMRDQEHIARISYGKDSLKMLEVIKSRGFPLDRITTTDVWATDTISANLPPVEAFKERMDQRIWDMYRIEVEHLCAKNKDGSKKTYEQMFYHVPDRRSQIGQVERETDSGPAQFSASQISGTPGVRLDSNGVPNYRIQGAIKGFPGITGVNWCQKLKLVKDQRIPSPDIPLVQENSKSTRSKHLFF
jgi:hypothetical protein